MINSFEGKHRFLSNFYGVWIVYEGIPYPTSEHAYQAAKTLDEVQRGLISRYPTPGQAKRAGKTIAIRPDWDKVKEKVMYDILKIKFLNPFLREKLLETGNDYIIEGNRWHDNTWGICECSKCDHTGLNLLGKLLMKVREELSTNNT